MAEIIKIRRVKIEGKTRLGLFFEFNNKLIEVIRGIDGRRWSKLEKCWYFNWGERTLDLIIEGFNGIAELDLTELNQELGDIYRDTPVNFYDLPQETREDIETTKRWMISERYSPRTIENYIGILITFFHFFKERKISDIGNNDVENFNNDYIIKKGYSISYQRQCINAIKVFYGRVQNRKMVLDSLTRPRKALKLPVVLAPSEVQDILGQIKNPKHLAIISLIYSSGLRISEAVNMRIKDIDSSRMVLNIRSAKGNKDRQIGLLFRILEMLRDYYKKFSPKEWLFENPQGGKYSAESIRKILSEACSRAKIRKKVTPHTLRHSYATHLLENGTDLRYIQELLGHLSSKTTEIYTHVSTKQINKIESPFDRLKLPDFPKDDKK